MNWKSTTLLSFRPLLCCNHYKAYFHWFHFVTLCISAKVSLIEQSKEIYLMLVAAMRTVNRKWTTFHNVLLCAQANSNSKNICLLAVHMIGACHAATNQLFSSVLHCFVHHRAKGSDTAHRGWYHMDAVVWMCWCVLASAHKILPSLKWHSCPLFY